LGIKKPLGRKYTVETHPERDKIIKAICKGDQTFRAIAGQYGISKSTITSYVNGKFYQKVVAEAAKRDEKIGQSFLSRIEQVMHRMQKLYDACDEYLTDPNNPEKYDLTPRACEIDVKYRTVEPDTDKMITRTEGLQTLLEKLDGQGYQPWEIKMKVADPRKLIIETAKAITPQLELMAKIEGLVKENVSVSINQYWIDIKAIILKATEKHPEVREKIVKELEKSDQGA
jgi:hypothetical protein